jgi:hypothetical protein
MATPASALAPVKGVFETGVYIFPEGRAPDAPLAFDRVQRAGSSLVRLQVRWREIAPTDRPPGFQATNPADPAYDWDVLDREMRLAVDRGLKPLLSVFLAPKWAQGGPDLNGWGATEIDPEALAQFARALATRYSGSFRALPRARHYLVWNEPNVSVYLNPQFSRGKPIGPSLYRTMANRFSAAVHGVRADNVVVGGALSPFTVTSGDTVTIGPLRFMRELFCLSRAPKPVSTCSQRVDIDVWAHHPYTSGGPTHSAAHRDDVSLGDLDEMHELLKAAVRLKHIRSRGQVPFWVTEFSWDTRPADPKGVPLSLQARWVSEALYQMWSNGVSAVIWLQLRDQPFPSQLFQGGLYGHGGERLSADRPKPALAAFRFPFVAFPRGETVWVWGRAPGGTVQTVVLERKSGGVWKRIDSVRVGRSGIFSGALSVPPVTTDVFRARLVGGPSSIEFSLRPTPDIRVNPFGT